MDSRTAYVALALMMLANSGALGLILRDLPDPLRRPVRSWQGGTLLMGGGYLIYALHALPLPVQATLANGGMLFGLTLCWRAVRQFDGLPTPGRLLLPAVLGTGAILWFATIQPDTLARILVISLASGAILADCVRVLAGRQDGSRSRQLLLALFIVILALGTLRFGYFAWAGIPPDFSIADNSRAANIVSPLVAAMLPVLGTTAFTLMGSERLRRQWEHAASTDYLTGLPNRRTITELGRQRFAQEQELAIALIDVDKFKSINDHFGHEAGDLALRHVAASLQADALPAEALARTGGEEFVALLGPAVGLAPLDAAQRAAERLRQAVQRHPFLLRGQRIPLTVSVGIAVAQPGDADFDSLLRRADQAMYAAKSAGRNRVALAA